jgi:hypothetical protein
MLPVKDQFVILSQTLLSVRIERYLRPRTLRAGPNFLLGFFAVVPGFNPDAEDDEPADEDEEDEDDDEDDE